VWSSCSGSSVARPARGPKAGWRQQAPSVTGLFHYGAMTENIVIDCDRCAMAGTSACEDCLVTRICDGPPGGSVVVDMTERRALRLLEAAQLIPPVRHRIRA